MVLGAHGPIIRRSVPGLKTVREILLDGILFTPLGAAWTEVVAGSGTSVQAAGYKETTTGTTTGSTSRLYTDVLNFPGTTFPVDFSKRILWGFTIRRVTSDAAIIARVQLKAATTEGALAASGLGVRAANLTLTGESYRTSGAFTATIQTMTAGDAYNILVDHEPAVPRVRFYVNGVLQATQSTTGNIPNAAIASVGMITSILNGAGTANAFSQIGAPWIYQGL